MTNIIKEKELDAFRQSYEEDSLNQLKERAVTLNGINASVTDNRIVSQAKPIFSIDVEAGEITNQLHSGRCWMFAGLNVLRTIAMKKLEIKNLELSQTYLQFYDKLEKANSFLEKVIELKDQPLTSQLNIYNFQTAYGDGGYWSYFVNLVKKYGVMPRSEMPTTVTSDDTTQLNNLLTKVLNQDAMILRSKCDKMATDETLRKHKQKMLEDVYRILAISLGVPPKEFTFEYEAKEAKKDDKNKEKKEKYRILKTMTPKEFFDTYIGEDLNEYVNIANAQLPNFEPYKAYTNHLLTSVLGGVPEIYFEVPLSVMKDAVIASLKNGELVWFGSDVSASSLRKQGILSDNVYAYDAFFNLKSTLKKGERLSYYTSFCNHAMTFTGVNLVNNKPNRWKVENSWGKDNGFSGFYVMDDAWFDNYVYETIVKKAYLPADVVKKYEAAIKKPIEVDPFYAIFANLD